MLLTQKKILLDRLYYHYGKQNYDFFIFSLEKLDNKIKSSKWISYKDIFLNNKKVSKEFLLRANNRTILPCEIVLDIESPDKLQEIISNLQLKDFCFSVYSTGSRGFHIHLFFNRPLSYEEKVNFIEKFGLGVAEKEKAGNKSPIALENCEHFKSGKIKTCTLSYSVDETDINNLDIDYEKTFEDENISLSVFKIDKVALEFRDKKINELLHKKSPLTDFEKNILNSFIERK